MQKLHSTRLAQWAEKLAVDNEDGLTTAQLMASHSHLLLLATLYAYA